ncbi:MAG: DUF4102 domain-containing protein, partial [Comamonadaceae bacterium]|nr:DUF4102 domain-containing protein [Comamonadaceae bacterium]
CPPDKQQAFLWDANVAGLGLRATPAGKPAYVFQGLYQGKYVRVTIGSTDAWSIADARAKARELQRLIDEGADPRTPKREALAAAAAQEREQAAAAEQAAREAVTVGEAWAAYIADRRPHWGALHAADHERLARAGGQASNRGKRPGAPLWCASAGATWRAWPPTCASKTTPPGWCWCLTWARNRAPLKSRASWVAAWPPCPRARRKTSTQTTLHIAMVRTYWPSCWKPRNSPQHPRPQNRA